MPETSPLTSCAAALFTIRIFLMHLFACDPVLAHNFTLISITEIEAYTSLIPSHLKIKHALNIFGLDRANKPVFKIWPFLFLGNFVCVCVCALICRMNTFPYCTALCG